jgi:hypothetical protein
MESDTYEVLYNSCYGKFDMPDGMIKEIFKLYPPHSEIGSIFFNEERFIHFIEEEEEPHPSWKFYMYNIIRKREPYIDGYSKLWFKHKINTNIIPSHYIQNDITKKIYFEELREFHKETRKSPELIKLLKDGGHIGKQFSFTLLKIAKIPNYYDFHIDDYNGGKETIVPLFPYRETVAELLTYIDDRDETKLSVITKKLVKKEMTQSEILHF